MFRFRNVLIFSAIMVASMGAQPRLLRAEEPVTLAELRACGLTAGPVMKARGVVDGDTLTLEDGRQVRLVGLQAPKLPLGRRGFEPWPMASTAKDVLEKLVKGRSLRLMYGGNREDRHGRILAHLLVLEGPLQGTKGVWVEQAMLKQGLARVYSFRDNRACISELLTFERAARASQIGIWGHAYYDVREVEKLEDLIDTFQVFQGIVLNAERRSEGVYLNFGEDWRSDATIFIAKKNLRRFEKSDLDLLSLENKRVRARGWLDLRNGPMVDLTHPEQIEIVDEE
jgi:endonuclease YncB( thermonuclease family)